MRYCWTYSSFLSFLFILSCLDSGICLEYQEIQVMESLRNLSSSWKNATSVDPCGWGGVICTQDGRSVIELHMSSFGLKSNPWQTVCQLQDLQVLDLSNNSLSTPSEDDIKACTSLVSLNISANLMSGSVPLLVPRRKLLQFPDVSHNGPVADFGPQIWNWTDALYFSGNPDLCNGQCASAPATTTKKRFSAILLIEVAVAGAVLGSGAVALSIVACKYFRRKIEGHFTHPDSIHRLRIDFKKGVEATLDPANVILKNRFSTYYKAVMPSGITYSVKKLNWTDKSSNSGNYRKLRAELEKQGQLSHPNILTPLAHVLGTYCAYLFYEYVHRGCLSDFLHTSSVSVLDWPSRCSIAIGVAQGLAFLHGCQQPIFHLDLTAKNILLKSLTEPEIGDIELFKIIDPSKGTGIISVIAGSVGYAPPEYAYTMRVTAAGNVYSFGVILLELLTGRPPITSGMDLAKWVQSTLSGMETWEQILDTRINNFSPQIQNQMISMWKVALSCISSSPESRPEMKDVVGMLQMVSQVAD